MPNVDTSTPEHKRGVAKMIALVFVLSMGGGLGLAYKITKAEAANEQARTAPVPESPK